MDCWIGDLPLQAFQCLLNLYILFQPSRSGEEAVKQPIPMTLSDELQLRCAAYMQGEVERYVDFLDEERGAEDEDESGSEESSGLSDQDGVETRRPKKAKKDGKKPEQAGTLPIIRFALRSWDQVRRGCLSPGWNASTRFIWLSVRFCARFGRGRLVLSILRCCWGIMGACRVCTISAPR